MCQTLPEEITDQAKLILSFLINKRRALKSNSLQKQLIMQYLLGELSEEEQNLLEERYFADPALFQEIRATRDDLIDAYLRGELPSDERERFEKHFLASPHRQERVEFARALIRTADQNAKPEAQLRPKELPAPRRDWFFAPQLSFAKATIALAVIALIFLGYWFLSRNSDRIEEAKQATPPPQTSPSGIPRASVQPNELPSPNLAKPPEGTPTRVNPNQNIATFTLTPGALRDSTVKVLRIPGNLNQMELRLEVEGGPYQRYQAELRTAEGDQKWRKAQIRPESDPARQRVVVRLPAALFENADYVLRLNGVTSKNESVPVGSYFFRVERK